MKIAEWLIQCHVQMSPILLVLNGLTVKWIKAYAYTRGIHGFVWGSQKRRHIFKMKQIFNKKFATLLKNHVDPFEMNPNIGCRPDLYHNTNSFWPLCLRAKKRATIGYMTITIISLTSLNKRLDCHSKYLRLLNDENYADEQFEYVMPEYYASKNYGRILLMI